MSSEVETYRPANASGYPHISYGLPFAKACAKHARDTFRSSRAFLIASGSLSRDTDRVERLQEALGDGLAGTRCGLKPHTSWSEVLEVTREAKRLGADLLITLGAGSLTDAAKVIATAMANDAETFEDLDRLHSGGDWSQQRPDLAPPAVSIISIPTSLSGGEYSFLGGATNDRDHHKYGFGHPTRGPALVILDPHLTITTPDHVWLQSGVRAVDHCVEGLCSLQATPESDVDAANGLRLLVPGLLRTREDPRDLAARHDCQMGVIEAMKTVFQHGVPMGASHGIGHQLGPLGVGHGETSCILLPAVCKYNAGVNRERQTLVADLLRADPDVSRLLRNRGLASAPADLGDVLDVVIAALGLPRSLKAVGVGEERFDELAGNSLRDKWCGTNPRPLREKEDVLEILAMVKG